MSSESLGFFARLVLAFVIPWKVLFDGTLALRVKQLSEGGLGALPESTSAPKAADPVTFKVADEPKVEVKPKVEEKAKVAEKPAGPDFASALHLLAILQRDGRLVDFFSEDVAGFSDAEVGAAARMVHDGCAKAFRQYFTLSPIRSEAEEAKVTVNAGFNPAEIRLTGNVSGEPPYKGTLAHAGWRVTKVALPERPAGADPHIIAPAEIEL